MEKILKNRIIITGGCGFIGQALTTRFYDLDYKNFIIIDKKEPKIKHKGFYLGDFNNVDLLNSIIQENDIIIHLACSTVPALSEKNREKDIIENVVGTLKLLEVCVNKKINKFIFLSSGGAIYGDVGKNLSKESDTTTPINSYGIIKLCIEKYIKLFKHLYDLDYLILRVANPYGYIDFSKRQQGIVDVLLKKIYNNEDIKIWGNGEVCRDFIYIDDLIDFIIKSLEYDIKNEVINVGTGEATSINDILKIIIDTTEKKPQIKYHRGRDVDVKYNALNISKAKKVVDWSSKISVIEGIKKSYLNIKNSR